VAIGTSLSGGLDSSALVALCHTANADQYTHKCFTATFPGYEKDEMKHAALVADTFNITHIPVYIDEKDLTGLMEKASLQNEEPLASASALIQYEVYRRARENGVTVLLDGQGADELFGGYHKYYKWLWQGLYAQNALKSSGELKAARSLGITEPFGTNNKLAALFPHFAAAIQQGRKKRHAFRQTDLNREFAFANKEELAYLLPVKFDLNSALHTDAFGYGLEELLKLADRNSMAHGVEVRLPYLSHGLAEFLFSLPAQFKIKEGWTKWLLRKSAEALLPKEIIWRKDKIGFEPPQKSWMQQSEVQQAIQDAKAVLVDKGVLDKSVLNKKIQPHDAHAAVNKDWRYWSASFLFH
jgi:asparagine synthase (glutamine-hydrolysing)